jgi:putative tryptophan/tyrosine transport system substrate-binding protein
MIRRREFITLLGGAALWPNIGWTEQSSGPMRRIAILMPYAKGDAEFEARVRTLREELQKLGWTEGAKVTFDERWTTDNMDAVRANAASLVDSNPDAIVAIGGRVLPVLLGLTQTVPIVVPGSSDPVGTGLAESLARPGRNVTGFSLFEVSIFGKMLEVLKQVAPAISRVALIFNPDNPNTVLYQRSFETFTALLGVEPTVFTIHGLADIERTLAGWAERRDSGVFFPPDVTISALRREIIALVERHRLPAIYSEPVFAQSGGLVIYGADRLDLYRRSAGYVDRILRGERPGDLPFQQPTKYQLIINLKTARALGLEPSPMLLARADEVIE